MKETEFQEYISDILVVEGSYEIVMLCNATPTSPIEASSIKLVGRDQTSIPFELARVSNDGRLTIKFSINHEFDRVSMAINGAQDEGWEYGGLQKMDDPIHFQADFFDFHYSLRDHVSQMDRIMRFTYGEDELSQLFKTLRYEMTVHHSQLSDRLTQLEKPGS